MSELKLVAVGDMMLGRGVGDNIAKHGASFPFSNVRSMLSEGDVLFGVFDAPVSIKGAPNPDKPKGFPLLSCAPGSVSGLKEAGFDVVHAGTNHILDFGEEGLIATIDSLERAGIEHIGAGRDLREARKPVVIERNGIRIGFLGYCLSYPADTNKAGCAPLKINLILDDLKSLRGKVDHVIVSLHHGIEYSLYPYPEYIDLTHKIVDAGARAVLGHHPHTIQGCERYKNGLIMYSLGNFIFDNDEKPNDRSGASRIRIDLEREGIIAESDTNKFYEGMILSVSLTKDGIKEVEYTPVVINDDFQPTIADGNRKKVILSYFHAISSALGNRRLPFFKDLSRLYAEEDVGSLFRKNISEIFTRLHKIRPRHLRQLIKYIEAKSVR